VHPNRTTREGRHFQVRTPDFVVASVEYASGPVLRLTTNWYVEQGNSPQHGIEFHGDEGSLVTDWLRGDAPVQIAPVGEKFSEVPLVRQPVKGIIWSRALPDLARAIAEGRPHRASGDLAAHLVDVMSAIATSIASGGPVDVTSTFPPPAPMEWAR
jgi:predicted dehydrogenase